MDDFKVPRMLKNARRSLCLTQELVSDKTGINRSYLSRYECGIHKLSSADVRVLKDYYKGKGFTFPSSDSEKIDLTEGSTLDSWEGRRQRISCDGCVHYMPKFGSGGGSCRRRAPELAGWPVVSDFDWCGDYKVDKSKLGG